MDKRLISTMVVCMCIIFLWQTFFMPKNDRASQQAKQDQEQQQGSAEQKANKGNAPTTGSDNKEISSSGTNSSSAAEAGDKKEFTIPAFEEKSISLKSGKVELDFSTLGAGINSIRLIEHKENDFESSLMLVDPSLQSGIAYGLVYFKGTEAPQDLRKVVWKLESEDQSSSTVVFSYPISEDREIRKSFRLRKDEYILEIAVEFVGAGFANAQGDYYELQGPKRIRFDVGATYNNKYAVAIGQDKVEEVALDSMEALSHELASTDLLGTYEDHKNQDRVQWAGHVSNFYALIIRPVDVVGASSRMRMIAGQSLPLGEEHEAGRQAFNSTMAIRVPVVQGKHSFESYAGPLSETELAKYSEFSFGRMIDHGKFLGPLISIFLTILGFFHSIVGSWGFSIILLTFLIKLLLHPINKKNQAVMMRQQKKMAKIQPKMKEIKERNKNDPLKGNQEVQALMQEHGVNPVAMFGGCLLMFVQLPIWIGLINTFRESIELRHASFFYVQDLTQADHLFGLPFIVPILGWTHFNLLPLIYVFLTIVSQKLQPKAADPQMQQQQKIMMYMMVAFGFIFYNFASALLIYFITSQALGIVEQRMIRKQLDAEDQTEEGGSKAAVAG